MWKLVDTRRQCQQLLLQSLQQPSAPQGTCIEMIHVLKHCLIVTLMHEITDCLQGCENFFSLKWNNPTVTYEEVTCPPELASLHCAHPYALEATMPATCSNNVVTSGTPKPTSKPTPKPSTRKPTPKPSTRKPTLKPVVTSGTRKPTTKPSNATVGKGYCNW